MGFTFGAAIFTFALGAAAVAGGLAVLHYGDRAVRRTGQLQRRTEARALAALIPKQMPDNRRAEWPPACT